MSRIEDVVITLIVCFFGGLLALVALAVPSFWPLWIPVAMLAWAMIQLWRPL